MRGCKAQQCANNKNNIYVRDGAAVQEIGLIDKEKYAKATQGEIRSELLILTEKQKAHIIDRRGQEFFEKYTCFFAQIAIDPDFIFLYKKHVNSAFACKTLTQCGMNLLLVIRLSIVDDKEGIENSLITVLHEGEARYMRRLRNSIPIYKRKIE